MRLEPDRRRMLIAGSCLAVAVVCAALVIQRRPEPPPPAVVGPTPEAITVPSLTWRFGDLDIDPDRLGSADALRGFRQQRVWLGEWRRHEVGNDVESAHELRMGDLALPKVRVHLHDGQVVAVRAYDTSWGGAIYLDDFTNELDGRFGRPTVRGRGANWARTWTGEEVVVTLRVVDGTRLEFEAALRSEVVGRPFVKAVPLRVSHLPTHAMDADAVPGAPHALYWIEFVEKHVPPPRVRCRVMGIDTGVLKGRFWYALFEPPIDVPIVDRTVWIPWREGSTAGVLQVEGYDPVPVRWGDPEGREWSWCDGFEVRLGVVQPDGRGGTG